MQKILLDSSVFLEVMLKGTRERQAAAVLAAVSGGRAEGVVSALSIAEVKYHALRKLGHARASEAAYLVQNFPNSRVVDVTPGMASTAADLRFKYYDRRNRQMSFADAVLAATALQAGCSKIVSGDSDLKGLEEIAFEGY